MAAPIILYDNRLADGTVTATTTAAGYAAANIIDWRAYTFWRSADTATQYLTVDCGEALAADAVGIHGHNLFSVGATLAVECSSDDFATDVTVASAGALVTSDGPLLRTFAAQTKRYWRIKITTLSAACYIAVAAIGARFTFSESIDGEFTPAAERFDSDVESSPGQMLGGVRGFIERSSMVDFEYVTDVWFRGTFMPIWDGHLGRLLPFFWAPNTDLSAADVCLYRIEPGSALDARYVANGWRSFSLRLVGAGA